MAGADNRRTKRLRKTKAQLVDELEALEREVAKLQAGAAPAADSSAETEQGLRAVVDNSPTAIFVRDVEGHFLFVNKTYEEWFNVDRVDIIGKTPHDIFLPEMADRITEFEHEVLESGSRIERETTATLPDGTTRTSWVIMFPLADASGKIVRVCGIITDLAERKRAEAALRQSEALFRAVVSHSPTKIHIKDVEGRYTLINKEAEKLFGISDEEGRGKTSYDLFPKDVADAFMAHDRAVIDSGRTVEEEEEFTLEDGVHTFLTVKFPIYDLDGVAAVGAVGTDITERKRAEDTARRLARAIGGLSENFSLYGPDDRLVICNQRYREINATIAEATKPGVLFEDHLRAFVAAGLAPQATGREEEFIQERLEQHRNPSGPFEIARQDGRWYRVHEQKLPDGSTVTIASDITDIKRAQEALKESQARLANILDNSPAPIYFKDTDGRFLVANKQFEKMYDVKFEDIRGKKSKDIFSGGLGDSFFQHDVAVLTSRRVIEREENIFGRNYLTLKFPIVDPSGKLLGLGGIETDVTELKNAEKELRTAKEQAEFANRAKTEFLANMSHELRTPLNSILGFSEVLMNQTLGPVGNPKVQEYAEDIHNSGNHLLSLIGEVLDLSKLEAGEFRIVESEIDVAQAVKTCIRMIEGRATAESAPVKTTFNDSLPPLLADERRFKQIVLNLLGNAVKFTPPEGEVTVSARVGDGGGYIIQVADNGVGIAAEDIAKVLEPFGQARDVFTRDYEGTGLGLYLAQSLTELHGGALEIESEIDRGTTVTIRMPKERTIAPAQKRRRRAR